MAIKVSLYQPHERAGILNFIEGHPQIHHHLDWEPIPQWLRDPHNMIALAWEGDELCGLMACSPPHQFISWLRLLALPLDQQAEVFHALWNYLYPLLQRQAVHTLAAMAQRPWVMSLLEHYGFQLADHVINLRRFAQPVPPAPPVKIRRVRWWDFRKVLAVDHAAFGALWQLRAPDLTEAARRSHYYTVAVLNSKIVGYQLSMRYAESMHLSRLATLPHYQNQGIASSLVADLLNLSEKLGIEITTVNTQASNYSSRHIYERFGFEYEQEELPIYLRVLG